MAATNQQVQIIIKRSKKGGHAAHHGGAWKVAYADFVTAMMAFFLLLWLLNATTEAQKQGISDYFSPSTVSTSSGGAGGLLGGRAISSPGAMTSRTAQPSVSLNLEPTSANVDGDAEQEGGISDREAEEADKLGGTSDGDKSGGDREAAEHKAKREAEETRFDRVEQQLLEAVDKDPELRAMADNLLVDRTSEGLRVQVIDKEGKSMFASGSAVMLQRTRKLMSKIAKVMEAMTNKIKITGHTDSVPFRGGRRGHGNWELSSERAQAARRVLVASGLSASRIDSVAGRASRDPLLKDDPKSARNRRISIVLLRDVPSAPPVGAKPRKTTKAAPPPANAEKLKQDWTGPRVR